MPQVLRHLNAVVLFRLGADVIVTGTGRDPSTFPADEIAAGLKDIKRISKQSLAEGRKTFPPVVDVTNPEHTKMMAMRTIKKLGRIDSW